MLSKRSPSHIHHEFCACDDIKFSQAEVATPRELASSATVRSRSPRSRSCVRPQPTTRIQDLDHSTMGGGTPPNSLSDSILSTISVSLITVHSPRRHAPDEHATQTEDMVEITRQATEDLAVSHHEDPDGSKYRLLYTKSKVYVNPTAYARDNIPGFVAIVKRVRHRPQSGKPTCVLTIHSACTGCSEPHLSNRVDTRESVG